MDEVVPIRNTALIEALDQLVTRINQVALAVSRDIKVANPDELPAASLLQARITSDALELATRLAELCWRMELLGGSESPG